MVEVDDLRPMRTLGDAAWPSGSLGMTMRSSARGLLKWFSGVTGGFTSGSRQAGLAPGAVEKKSVMFRDHLRF